MELATALVWTLRIVLPIILFCIYFKLQAPKDDLYSGPTDNVHTKTTLLAGRKATVGAPSPESMANIRLKNQEEAPELFAGRGGKGARRGTDDSRGAPRERRERRDKDSRKTEEEQDTTVTEEPSKSIKQEGCEFSPSEEKMHLESLLNYVAFNRKEQQRNFLPEENGAPPPPPPPPRKEDASGSSAISGPTAEKANAEAQMVLRGALGIKRSDVAKNLHAQLVEASVEASESTFELMIDVCLLGKDLKGASDFLMKMETAGFLPNSDLLDKVMNLYSQQKSEKEKEKLAKTQPLLASNDLFEGMVTQASVVEPVWEGDAEGCRTKLSSTAAVFVPSFIPAPPPRVEMMEMDPTAELGEDYMQRTKLTAESKPFEPKFDVTFEPYMYTWTADEAEEHDFEKGHNGKGWEKGKGRGKGSQKGAGKSKGHTNGKNWDVSCDYWSTDANWSSDTKWSTDDGWDYDTKAPAKKVWVAKQPKDAEANNAKSDNSSREGKWIPKTPTVKTWKPKVESSESAEVS